MREPAPRRDRPEEVPEGADGRRLSARARGAIPRAAVAALLVAAPALVLPQVGVGAVEISLIVALLVSLLVLFEYGATAPALVDFRFAPPANRMRFAVAALAMAPTLAFVWALGADGALASALRGAGRALGEALGGPGTPAGFVAEVLRRPAALAPDPAVQAAAALASTAAWVATAGFAAVIWFGRWPGPFDAFDRFVNLPTFEPVTGPDAPGRLAGRALMVMATGFAAPFGALAAASLIVRNYDADAFASPLALVWLLTLWAAAPGAVILRGVALLKLSRLIRAEERGARA